LVNTIVTVPALAVSAEVVYLSCPSGLAARLTVLVPVGAGAAGVELVVLAGVEVVVLAGVEVVVLAGVEVEELVELDVLLVEEPPQPASATTPTARASIVEIGCLRAGSSLRELIC
jgi:hypothetical protein